MFPNQLPPRPRLSLILFAGIGAACAIFLISVADQLLPHPLIMAPIGASCFLLFAMPDAPLAQPRHVVGGHFLATLAGLICLTIFGDHLLSLALAMGIAVSAMLFCRAPHPPAGAMPLVVFYGQFDWYFLFTPVLSGSVLLVGFAWAYLNWIQGKKYPQYW